MPPTACRHRGLLRTCHQREPEKRGEVGKREEKKNIFLDTKCCYYSCGVWKGAPADPCSVLSRGTQLESTPFSACWTKWRLVEAAEGLKGDTGAQVLNTKLPVAAKHTDANTPCRQTCRRVLWFVNASTRRAGRGRKWLVATEREKPGRHKTTPDCVKDTCGPRFLHKQLTFPSRNFTYF